MDDFAGVEPGSVDTVIINSVIHYFPDAEYLVRVLEESLRALSPGGRIYIGDVQSGALLATHHLTEQLDHLPAEMPLEECRKIVARRLAIEDELVVDPGFFALLKARMPSIAHIEFHHRRGRIVNELTRFHYDVVIHRHPLPAPALAVPWQDWSEANVSLDVLSKYLREGKLPAFGLTAVPSSRTARSVAALLLLHASDAPATVGGLKAALDAVSRGLDPEDFWALEEEVPYSVDIRWSSTALDGGFDVLFVPEGGADPRSVLGPAAAVGSTARTCAPARRC